METLAIVGKVVGGIVAGIAIFVVAPMALAWLVACATKEREPWHTALLVLLVCSGVLLASIAGGLRSTATAILLGVAFSLLLLRRAFGPWRPEELVQLEVLVLTGIALLR